MLYWTFSLSEGIHMTPEIKTLILDLFGIEAIKFGNFTLKSGIQSPIYIDMRIVISYPVLMKKLSGCLLKLSKNLTFDALCGVPYAAVPYATALALEGKYPLLMCRKETKDYGTKKLIEGKFEQGQTCLLIEDVITFGTSILETADAMKKQGLKINDVIVLLDRQQGGAQKLKEHGIQLHSLIDLLGLLEVLSEQKKISEDTLQNVYAFLKVSQSKAIS